MYILGLVLALLYQSGGGFVKVFVHLYQKGGTFYPYYTIIWEPMQGGGGGIMVRTICIMRCLTPVSPVYIEITGVIHGTYVPLQSSWNVA